MDNWVIEQDGKLIVYKKSPKVKEEIEEMIEFFRIGDCKYD